MCIPGRIDDLRHLLYIVRICPASEKPVRDVLIRTEEFHDRFSKIVLRLLQPARKVLRVRLILFFVCLEITDRFPLCFRPEHLMLFFRDLQHFRELREFEFPVLFLQLRSLPVGIFFIDRHESGYSRRRHVIFLTGKFRKAAIPVELIGLRPLYPRQLPADPDEALHDPAKVPLDFFFCFPVLAEIHRQLCVLFHLVLLSFLI